MSLEVIKRVTSVEEKAREGRTAAEAEAQRMLADAEKNGSMLLQQVRTDSAAEGKKLLKLAEERAVQKTGEIEQAAGSESAALRQTAGEHMKEAVDFIVGRVVSR